MRRKSSNPSSFVIGLLVAISMFSFIYLNGLPTLGIQTKENPSGPVKEQNAGQDEERHFRLPDLRALDKAVELVERSTRF